MRFRVLGPVEIEADDGRLIKLARRRERCLLGLLLLEPSRVVSLSRLCELLWEGDPPATARHAVHNHVSAIRSALASAGAQDANIVLVSHGSGYLIETARETVDVHRMRLLVDQARCSGDPAGRLPLLQDALALWRGPVFHNAAGEWLREVIGPEFDELYLAAAEALAQAQLDLGNFAEALPDLARLTSLHPAREGLIALQMKALHGTGRTPEALELFQKTRSYLREQLGLDPGAGLIAQHQLILRGEQPPPARAPADEAKLLGVATPYQVPVAVRGFIGRTKELESLDGLMSIAAVSGSGGVGKTSLVVHWAHRASDCFPDGQLFVNLRGFDPARAPLEPADVLRGFLYALGVAPKQVPLEFEAQVGLYRSLMARRRMLVILDNARDAEQVRPLMPGASGCMTIATSRSQLLGLVTVEGAYPIPLSPFDASDAAELLTHRLGAERISAQPDAVEQIIGSCGGLPLALAIASARAVSVPQSPLDALASDLLEARGSLTPFAADDPAADLRAVFSSSYRAVSRPAARLFRALSLAPGQDISLAATASLAGVSRQETQATLGELAETSLVSEPTNGRFALHDLLRSYAAELGDGEDELGDGEELASARRRILSHYLHSSYAANRQLFPSRESLAIEPAEHGITPEQFDSQQQARAWCTLERPALLAAVELAEQAGLDALAWQLAWTLTTFLDHGGHWIDWATSQEVALRSAQRLGDKGYQAKSHRFLGRVYAWLARYPEAHEHLRHALEICAEDNDDTGAASGHMLVAWVLEREERHQEATAHALTALELYRSAGHTAGQADALNLVGWKYALQGEYELALPYCEEALAMQQQLGYVYGEANTWDSLGYTHHHLGRHDEAIRCYGRAADLFRGNRNRHFEAVTLDRLGDVHRDARDRATARRIWQQALTIFTELESPEANQVRAKLQHLR